MASFSKGTSFTDGVTGDVTAAKLHALVDAATPVAGLVTDRTAETSVASGDQVLIADASDSNALKKMTVTNLFKTDVSITSGTGTAGTVAIGPTGDTNTGLFFPAADTIAFAEGGAEAMRIDSSGNVGIGTNTPSTELTAYSGSAAGLVIKNSGRPSIIFSDTSYGDYSAISTDSGNLEIFNNAAGVTRFYTGGTERLRIDDNGDVGIGVTNPLVKLHVDGIARIGSGNDYQFDSTLKINGESTGTSGYLRFYTNSTERLRIDSSGQVGIGLTPTSRNNTRLQIVDGIGFPSTQVASSDANTLDDYEEGTWTPAISFGGASVGITYNTQTGVYTKIGRQVTVSCYIVLTNNGSSTGLVLVTGLPFTILNSSAAYGGAAIGYIRDITFADFPQAFGEINTTTIALRETTNAGAQTDLTEGNFADTARLMISYTYFV